MFTECLLLGAGVVLGRWQWLLSARVDKASWARTKASIQTRVIMEFERERQEHLLLSVMPAYIAVEVKKSISGRMSQQQQDRGDGQQFKDLYVQVKSGQSSVYSIVFKFSYFSKYFYSYLDIHILETREREHPVRGHRELHGAGGDSVRVPPGGHPQHALRHLRQARPGEDGGCGSVRLPHRQMLINIKSVVQKINLHTLCIFNGRLQQNGRISYGVVNM